MPFIAASATCLTFVSMDYLCFFHPLEVIIYIDYYGELSNCMSFFHFFRLAANWPATMQIVRLISQDHMNNKYALFSILLVSDCKHGLSFLYFQVLWISVQAVCWESRFFSFSSNEPAWISRAAAGKEAC